MNYREYVILHYLNAPSNQFSVCYLYPLWRSLQVSLLLLQAEHAVTVEVTSRDPNGTVLYGAKTKKRASERASQPASQPASQLAR